MNLLTELGITKDELIERTVCKILEIPSNAGVDDYGEFIELSIHEEVKKQVNDSIKSVIEQSKEVIQNTIDEAIKKNVEEAFTKPFYPLDNWGRPKSEKPTTIYDLIADEAKDFWNQTVNNRGEVVKSYSEKQTRAEYYAKKVMKEFYTKELERSAKSLVEEVREKIPDTFADEIAKSFKRYLLK